MNQKKIKQKKKDILDALKRCLDREAYSYISMQDVADEAQMSKGGLRYYFPTKEDLYCGLIDDFFNGIAADHLQMLKGIDDDKDRAFLSTLFGIERFVLNKKNIKIFINLLLYGFEDPKIMKPISVFFRNHLSLYLETLEKAKKKFQTIDSRDFDQMFHARIAQVIFLSTGVLEEIDPIGIDPSQLTRYVISLFQNK